MLSLSFSTVVGYAGIRTGQSRLQPVPVLFYFDGFYLYPVYALERLTLILLIIISVQAITHALVTCRYAHQNRIREVGDLSHLTALNTLNISSNEVFDLKGLEGCVGLETLICTHNFLESVESITPLLQLSHLQTLDLQNNKLDDPAVMDIFSKLTDLKCLYLKGNPVISKLRNYRCGILITVHGCIFCCNLAWLQSHHLANHCQAMSTLLAWNEHFWMLQRQSSFLFELKTHFSGWWMYMYTSSSYIASGTSARRLLAGTWHKQSTQWLRYLPEFVSYHTLEQCRFFVSTGTTALRDSGSRVWAPFGQNSDGCGSHMNDITFVFTPEAWTGECRKCNEKVRVIFSAPRTGSF